MKGDLNRALRDCLAAMDAGEAEAACLERYPEYAVELAPVLAVAGQLRALRGSQLTPAARVQAKATLHKAAARRTPRPTSRWLPWGIPARALAGLIAAVLLVVLSAGMVAASRPGDMAYPLRVEIERVPVLLAPAGFQRAAAELALAARRLDDLQAAQTSGRGPDNTALEALLEADRAAAQQAAKGDASLRDMVAQRMRSQARVLESMAAVSPGLEAAGRLRLAAQRTLALAGGLAGAGSGRPDPGSQPEGSATGETKEPTPTAARSPQPTATRNASATPVATQTFGPDPEASGPPDSAGNNWQTAGPHGTPNSTATPGHCPTGNPAGNGPRFPTAAPSAGPAPLMTPTPASAPTAVRGGPGPLSTLVPRPARTSTPGPEPASSGPGGQSPAPTAGPGGPGAPRTSYPGGGGWERLR